MNKQYKLEGNELVEIEPSFGISPREFPLLWAYLNPEWKESVGTKAIFGDSKSPEAKEIGQLIAKAMTFAREHPEQAKDFVYQEPEFRPEELKEI